MHYSHGRLTAARLPISGIAIKSLSRIPGTSDILAGGVVIHKNATTQAAVLEYTP
jgi:nicotinamide mononucleotide (NMN) deamidase PncC